MEIKNFNEKSISFLIHSQSLREWEKSNLSFAYSSLGRDLFLFLAIYGCIYEPVNLKVLVHSFYAYSESGVRKQLKSMVNSELIKIEQHKADKRSVKIVPTNKFHNLLKDWIVFNMAYKA